MFSSQNSQVSSAANYIEDVFSTYLYAGNSSTNNIVNNIDLAGKGGMVWIKSRTSAASHALWDTARTPYYYLVSNATSAQQSVGSSNALTSYNADGFTVTGGSNAWNGSQNYTSWTFRKQPKFFDVVTWTGDGSNTQTISHNLGSTPGCIITKLTSGSDSWRVYHRSLSTSDPGIKLNSTAAGGNSPYDYGDQSTVTSPTSTQFTAGINLNASGSTYVAYLFAHDAGGFGLTGADNVISCGSFTTDGSGNATVNLGYEPQFVLWKKSDGPVDGYSSWIIDDNMRGFTVDQGAQDLYPNSSSSEQATGANFGCSPTSTGFKVIYQASKTYIYIAIRRGPMKVPTTGTSVFAPVLATTPSSPYTATTNFPVDLLISSATVSSGKDAMDRLRGGTTTSFRTLFTNTTDSESVGTGNGIGFQSNTSVVDNSYWSGYGVNVIYWNFRRAPSFFDEVCYTGTGSQQNLTHNLGVAPELLIVKRRSAAGTSWATWVTSLTADQSLALNTTDDKTAVFSVGFWGSTFPTASVFTVGSNVNTNSNAQTYVAYLFATCAGVSKVGSYTGTGTTLQVNCGFTGGARFVLIKRTDSTGDWYVWDTARGIVSGNDPYLLLNSTAAEVTNTDYIDTYSAGFEISSTAPAAINASGGTFIFLAIA